MLDAQTNQTYDYFAKIIFINASALNSSWVLMNSAKIFGREDWEAVVANWVIT